MIRKPQNLLSIPTSITLVFTVTILTSSSACADVSNFQKSLEYARTLKDSSQREVAKFKPQEVFKSQKGGYTEEPPQANHYRGVEQSNAYEMEQVARVEITKDEDYKDTTEKSVPTPGKTVTENFKTRPVFKLSQEDEYIKKSRLIETNARNVVTGESNKHVDCKNRKLATCKIIHVEKTCNEEVRSIQRICEKVPKITTYINEIVCPNCQSLIITQHVNNHCPSGYGEMLYADMVQTQGDHWDDIRFCTRALSAGEGSECFSGGYYITSNRGNRDSGKATVPKKLHARIRMSNVYFGYIIGTIINETRGETLYSNTHFSNGQVIDLPYSDTQDQTFRFYATQPQGGGHGFFRFMDHRPGVMVLYIDHVFREKLADVTWPEEGGCRDI